MDSHNPRIPQQTSQDRAKGAVLIWRVFWNTVSNYIGKIITLSMGFLLTPFLVHQLGAGTFGLWALVGSVVAYGGLLDFGIAAAITKYTAEYRAKQRAQDAQALIATAFLLYLALGLIVILLSLVIAAIFPYIFNVPPEQHSEAMWLVLFSGLGVGIAIPCATPSAILRGLQRFDLLNALGVIGTLLSVSATVLILLRGGGVIGIVIANIAVTLLMQFPAYWLIHRIAPELELNLRAARREFVRTVASFSTSLFVINVSGQLQGQTDEIVIGAFRPLALVTPYALSRRLSDVARILTDQFLKVLLPLASELHATDDRARLRALYLVSTRLTLVSFMPFACILILLAGPLLTAWVGATYAPYAPLVIILTIAGLIDMSQWAASHVLQGMGRHRPLAYMSIASGIANLVLSVVLIQFLGLIGVALGTLVPTSIECLLFVMPYALRMLGISWREALREIILPSSLPAVPAAITILLLERLIPASGWASLSLIAVTGFLVYVLIYFTLGANAVEKLAYRQIARKMLRLVSRPPKASEIV